MRALKRISKITIEYCDSTAYAGYLTRETYYFYARANNSNQSGSRYILDVYSYNTTLCKNFIQQDETCAIEI
uniref:Uncharacterized protein n=1 Tax=Glossina morsitans morsitans TaxID=37546 RepID=A0A1B0G6P7_GLOMM